MKSPTESLKLIAENDFRLMVDETTPDDVWIVTPEGRHVQMLAGGTFRPALRISRGMFEAFLMESLVEGEVGNKLYRLTGAGCMRGRPAG